MRPPDRSPRRIAGIAAALVVAITVLAVIGIVVLSLREGLTPDSPAAYMRWVGRMIAVLAFATSGALIVSSQPRNTIGWLLIIPGLGPALSELMVVWLAGFEAAPSVVTPGLWMAIWFTTWSWLLLLFPILLILLLFPDGRLPSPRWRWVVAFAGLAMAVSLGLTAFSPNLDVYLGDAVVWSVPNPIGDSPWWEEVDRVFGRIAPGLAILSVACVAAVVVRFRRGNSVVRQQLKWPLWAMLFFGIVLNLTSAAARLEFDIAIALDILYGLALAAIPISVAIAVLKYRLYEIDRIISRTVTYVLVVGLLGALYFVSVTTVSRLFQTESPLAVAISTLAVAASFNPLRRRIQNAIDRRFNRARYDVQNVMDRFAATLRDRLDITELSLGWRDVVTETMQPSAVSVWIREDRT